MLALETLKTLEPPLYVEYHLEPRIDKPPAHRELRVMKLVDRSCILVEIIIKIPITLVVEDRAQPVELRLHKLSETPALVVAGLLERLLRLTLLAVE